MKPFNLERALAGDPVVTRDGRKVLKVLDGRHPNVEENYAVYALPEGAIYYLAFYEDGRISPHITTGADLFMVPKKREGWVNVVAGATTGTPTIGCLHMKMASAERAAESHGSNLIATVRIEWEE